MRVGRIITLVLGCLLIIPAIGILLGGAVLGTAHLLERDDDGYFDETIENMSTETVAITAEQLDFLAEPGEPDWVIDALDVDIRLRVTGTAAADDLFVGIAREADLDRYLAGVGHAEISSLSGSVPSYRTRSGADTVAAPTDQDFWVVSASGTGTQELFWEATNGRWAAVVMNADGSPGIAADVTVGARSDIIVGLAIGLFLVGAAMTAGAVALIVVGARNPTPEVGTAAEAGAGPTGQPTSEPAHLAAASPSLRPDSPVTLTATLDPELSRWKWLIKWFLAIPHLIVLAFLWIAFVVLTVVAGVAILFTGRYPRGIFDFNVGVMRWSWRVQFYATSGGIGTDRYPPFSLAPDDAEPAHLDVRYPRALSRPMVLVKWFLAIPHLIIVALLVGSTVNWLGFGDSNVGFDIAGGGGLMGLLTLVAGMVLLFTNEYPRPLFELIVGLNRWVYRVLAYVALMTDDYPPFRLDQGGTDQDAPRTPPQGDPPARESAGEFVDLRDPQDAPEPAGLR